MAVERPSTHQTEDESKLAFGQTLPSSWVLRDKPHDYGIDQEVKVFDEQVDAVDTMILFSLRSQPKSNDIQIRNVAIANEY